MLFELRHGIIYLLYSYVRYSMQGVKNEELKQAAIKLRQKGYSYPMIEKALGTPRATLNGWFNGLKLSQHATKTLLSRKKRNLVIVRKKALVVLKKQREEADRVNFEEVQNTFSKASFSVPVKELLLAMLYIGEGFKRKSTLGLGNSDRRVLASFVKLLKDIYNVNENKLTCYLHLRSDQDSQKETLFWSKAIKISKDKFRKPQFDKRTAGIKTWTNYHGVCVVYCHDAKLAKRLIVLQDLLLSKILHLGG